MSFISTVRINVDAGDGAAAMHPEKQVDGVVLWA
jgi:hypothetical protein